MKDCIGNSPSMNERFEIRNREDNCLVAGDGKISKTVWTLMMPACLVCLRAVNIGDMENCAFFDHINHLQNRSFVRVLVQKIICHCL